MLAFPPELPVRSLTDVRLSSAGMLPLSKKIVLPHPKPAQPLPFGYLTEDGATGNVASSQNYVTLFGVIHEAKNDNYNQ